MKGPPHCPSCGFSLYGDELKCPSCECSLHWCDACDKAVRYSLRQLPAYSNGVCLECFQWHIEHPSECDRATFNAIQNYLWCSWRECKRRAVAGRLFQAWWRLQLAYLEIWRRFIQAWFEHNNSEPIKGGGLAECI